MCSLIEPLCSAIPQPSEVELTAWVSTLCVGASDQAELTASGASVADQKIDDKTDGVIIIDANGSMLLINKAAYRMFGYDKGELEGKNVSIMMPQPFSSRHNSYLNNYLVTGVAKILNTNRHVVALRRVSMLAA